MSAGQAALGNDSPAARSFAAEPEFPEYEALIREFGEHGCAPCLTHSNNTARN